MINVPEALLSDLSLNLIAELFGIIATVFFVDRLLRNREKKRWLPAKNIVYSELLKIVAQALACATPNRKQVGLMTYDFGEVAAEIYIPNDLLSLTAISDIEDLSIEMSIRTADECSNLADRFTDLGSNISACLMSSGILIEPELLSLLLQLRGKLNEMEMMKQFIDTESLIAGRSDIFSAHINNIALSAANVVLWLDGRATRKRSFEDARNELMLKIDAQLKSTQTGQKST